MLAAALSILLPQLVIHVHWGAWIAAFLGELIGDLFGLVLAIYMWLSVPGRPVWRAIGFVSASTLAYPLAGLAGFFSAGLISRVGDVALQSAPAFSFFVGGAAGGFIVLLAALLMFSSETKVSRIFLQTLQWSMVAGVLGLVGSYLGPTLGGWSGSVVHGWHFLSFPRNTPDAENTYSLFLVWQSGMGAVLGNLLLRERYPHPLSEQQKLAGTVKPERTKIVRYVFFVLVVVGLARFCSKASKIQYDQAIQNWKNREHFLNVPSLANLEKVRPRPTDQMFLKNTIGGYLPQHDSVAECKPPVDWKTHLPIAPTAQCYRILYGVGSFDASANPTRWVEVAIRDYPNSAWANYELLEDPALSGGAAQAQTVEFGNRIYSDSHFKGQNGTESYLWTSGKQMVVMRFVSTPPGAFLEAYLEKYPSSN